MNEHSNREIEPFESALREFFHVPNVYTFSRGRVALYVTLKALNLQPGDEVLLPGYTCVMVPAAIQALRLKPMYADVNPQVYSSTFEEYQQRATAKTKVLILQHTYGIPVDAPSIIAWGREKGMYVIEDCCHAFGSTYDGHLCGTQSDAAFFSGQWNKPFTTGLGGMLIVQNGSLNQCVQDIIRAERETPSWLKTAQHTLQIWLHETFVTPRTANWITSIYRTAYEMGLIEGSSSPDEFQGRIPKGYVSAMSRAQAKKGNDEMGRIQNNIQHRKQVSDFYTNNLPSIGIQPLQLDSRQNAVLLRYPIRVCNKQECLKAAFQQGIELGSWFEFPLHPKVGEPEAFQYSEGTCPVAETISREVINLPTHLKVTDQFIERLFGFLKENARGI